MVQEKKFSYYTDSSQVIFKEYGRSIQEMVTHLLSIEDKPERTKMAYSLIEMMRKIGTAPSNESVEEYQKLWDHLYIMSDFQLDVDGPFPMPERSILQRKPMRVPYQTGTSKFRHYGHHLEQLVNKAKQMEDPELKENATIYLGRLMKNFYAIWNKEITEDAVIIKQLQILSEGALKVNLEKVQEGNLFDSAIQDVSQFVRSDSQPKNIRNNNSNNRNKNQRNNKRRRK